MAFSLWRSFQDWCYLESAYLPLLGRAVGLFGLAEGVYVWNGCYNNAEPFLVPAWRLQNHLLHLPMPPVSVSIMLFVIYALSCLFLFTGGFKKIVLLLIAGILLYFGSFDLSIMSADDLILEILFCLALLFSQRLHANCARRLVQIFVASYYFFSALQMVLFPPFVHGYALKNILTSAQYLTEYSAPWLANLSLMPEGCFAAFSCLTVAVQFFIAFGLFFRLTRKISLLMAVLFQGFLALTLGECILTLLVWTGLVSFIEKSPNFAFGQPLEQAPGFDPPRNLETIAAALFAAVMLLIPLRIYQWENHSVATLTQVDRGPWTFCTNLMRQGQDKMFAVYQSADGKNHREILAGKAATLSGDNQLLALAEYIYKEHQDIISIKIDSRTVIDAEHNCLKTLTAHPQDKALNAEIITKVVSTAKPAANPITKPVAKPVAKEVSK